MTSTFFISGSYRLESDKIQQDSFIQKHLDLS